MELTDSSIRHASGLSGIGPKIRRHALEPLLALLDGLSIVITGIAAAYFYHILAFDAAIRDVDFSSYAALSFLAAILFVSFSRATGAYDKFLYSPRIGTLTLTLLIWISVVCLLSLMAFLMKISASFSRGAVVCFFLAGAGGLILNRILWPWAINSLVGKNMLILRRVLVVRGEVIGKGDSKPKFKSDIADLRPNGFVLSHQLEVNFEDLHATKRIIPFVLELVCKKSIDEVFIEIDPSQMGRLEEIAGEMRLLPVPVRLILDPATQLFLSRPLMQIGEILVSEIQREPLTWTERTLKRILDLCVASSALILLSPLMVMAAVAIKIESGGPVFFVQDRKGFSGRIFRIYKFRSMKVAENGPVINQATQDDPRITHVGRFIRQTSIDELPQLWNVLVGDMSIVGPRPHAVAHDDYYSQKIGEYALRHHTKPGLTGLAQVKGLRGETAKVDDMRQRVESDIEYISNWSFGRDIVIILKTANVIFGQRKAF